MNSSKILYSNGKNDECYTPRYAVFPILKYLPKDKIIWCPFDTKESEFVKVLKENDFNVINTHIDYGQDFYNYEPKKWDIIVSNPPFTNKRKIFERCLSFNKPFALLMSNTWLNDAAPKQLFKEKDLQLLMFEQRVQYNNLKKITFSSSYYCWNLLPKQIIMDKLNIKGEIMLKIKDEYDLKELKKFGYYKHDCSSNYQKNIEYSPSSANWFFKSITKAIFITAKDRCIHYCTDEGNHHYQRFADTDNEYIQDIVSAGLVEKVADNET